jgi:hypothetical protein
MVAVRTHVAAACAGSRVKTEVNSFHSNPKYGHLQILRPVDLSLKEIARGPHFEIPSPEPQLLLIVSGICVLKLICWTLSVDLTEIEVAEAKGISGFFVNLRGSNDDWLQLQSASAPNPQKTS